MEYYYKSFEKTYPAHPWLTHKADFEYSRDTDPNSQVRSQAHPIYCWLRWNDHEVLDLSGVRKMLQDHQPKSFLFDK